MPRTAQNAKPRKPSKPRTTKDRIEAFLKEYAETCNIVAAAKNAGVHRDVHYQWLKKYPAYVRRFEKQQALAAEYFESECIERAIRGKPEPVYYQGNKCGTITRYSDGLAQFLLRGLMPEKYGNKTEISGPQGQPVQVNVKVNFVKRDDEPVDS